MKINTILNLLKENHLRIQMFGVLHLAVFGSYVRGEEKEDSDIDVLIEFAEGKKNFDNYMDLKIFLEDLFHKKIDLVIKDNIKPFYKDEILSTALYAA